MTYDQLVSQLVVNLQTTIRQLRSDGTIGMSAANLRQLVSFRGCAFANLNTRDRAFADALDHIQPLFPGFVVRS